MVRGAFARRTTFCEVSCKYDLIRSGRLPYASCSTASLKNSDIYILLLEVGRRNNTTNTCTDHSNTFRRERHTRAVTKMRHIPRWSFLRWSSAPLLNWSSSKRFRDYALLTVISVSPHCLPKFFKSGFISINHVMSEVWRVGKRDGGYEWHHERPLLRELTTRGIGAFDWKQIHEPTFCVWETRWVFRW